MHPGARLFTTHTARSNRMGVTRRALAAYSCRYIGSHPAVAAWQLTAGQRRAKISLSGYLGRQEVQAMFLVQDQIGDSTYLVLTGEDPRRSGYAGKVTDDAKWVAKKHFIADSGTREIGYLPREAPIDEIRLLEMNDRFVEITDDDIQQEIDAYRAGVRALRNGS